MAAGDITQKWGNSANMGITLASLASNNVAGRESNSVDITALGPVLDILVQAKIKLDTGTIANDKCVYLYLAGSEDGTKWPDPVTGNDAGCNTSNDMTLARAIDTPANGTTYISNPFSVASAFGGVLPRKFSAVVRNYSNCALTSNALDHGISYTPIYSQANQS